MARLEIKKIPGTRKSPLPKFIAPQLATLVKEPPSGDKWLHELKFDGYRMLCRSDRGNVQLGESMRDRIGRYLGISRNAERRSVREDEKFAARSLRSWSTRIRVMHPN